MKKMTKIKWKYKNDTDEIIIWKNNHWGQGEEKELAYPVPASLGLTCTQEGTMPDPVLFHDDLLIVSEDTEVINLNAPMLSDKVFLSLLCIGEGGVECRFNSLDNNPIPLDVRNFTQTMTWEMCSRIFLKNITETETHISVTAVEVCA